MTSLHKEHPHRHDVPLLIVAALVTLGIGVWLPIVTLEKLVFSSHTYSVITGVVELYRNGNILLAWLILGFSVAFPAIKLIGLLVIWFQGTSKAERHRSLAWL